MASLDLITIGRSSVDLYGAQVGGRLEDMASFAKYIGGSPTNTAVGGARLGLRTGLLTRVAGLFARRGFNIRSLAVGTTEVEGLSRITVVVEVEGAVGHMALLN